MSRYYGNLSSCSSDSSDSDVSNSDNESIGGARTDPSGASDLWRRSILHLDVDCFYCQCEEIDRDLRRFDPPKTLAIGQKHIIVTCNYEARKYGVAKLQLKSKAKELCPDLLIVDGSDLERYRRHSRAIYEAFRSSLQSIALEISHQTALHGVSASISTAGANSTRDRPTVAIQKGSGMDEMLADLSQIVEHHNDITNAINCDHAKQRLQKNYLNGIYIYGESNTTDGETVMVEDQTGAVSVISDLSSGRNDYRGIPESRKIAHTSASIPHAHRQLCRDRLLRAAIIANRVRDEVFESTGFHTTIGVSVSPQLAKTAVDVKKPQSTNIILPWKSQSLLYEMPLRKLQTFGNRTIKSLDDSLQDFHGNEDQRPEFWRVRSPSCSHFLMLPRQTILKCMQGVQSFQKSSSDHCDAMILRCRGIDETKVVDDDGSLPKSLSVENSFRRGSLTSRGRLYAEMDQLLDRLPRIIEDRGSSFKQPDSTYPTTIRVTLRFVIVNDKKKMGNRQENTRHWRPFKTISKQCPLTNGSAITSPRSDSVQCRRVLQPPTYELLNQLLQTDGVKLDVTRLNLAVTNFADNQSEKLVVEGKSSPLVRVQREQQQETQHQQQQLLPRQVNGDTKTLRSTNSPQRLLSARPRKHRGGTDPSTDSKQQHRAGQEHQPKRWSDIDPNVLSQLPPDIAAELGRSFPNNNKPAKKRKIDDFFARRK